MFSQMLENFQTFLTSRGMEIRSDGLVINTLLRHCLSWWVTGCCYIQLSLLFFLFLFQWLAAYQGEREVCVWNQDTALDIPSVQ